MSSDDLTKQMPTADRLEALIALVHEVAADVRELKARQESLEKLAAQQVARQESLERLVEQRLYDTRPIWEGVLSRLEAIEIDLDKAVGVSHEVRSDLRELPAQLREQLPALK